MSDWLNWAVQNVTPERLQSYMGYVKEHPEQLQALKEKVGGEIRAAVAPEKLSDLKQTVGGEIRDAIAEEQGAEKAQTWSSWLGLKSGAAAPAPTTPPTAIQSTRQKYIRLAVRNWKYTIPAASKFVVRPLHYISILWSLFLATLSARVLYYKSFNMLVSCTLT